MSQEFTFILAAIILLDIVAIFIIVNEDILYDPIEKFWKIVFILFLPFFGAIIQLHFLNNNYKPSKKCGGSNDDSRTYEFFNHDSGGGDGGGE